MTSINPQKTTVVPSSQAAGAAQVPLVPIQQTIISIPRKQTKLKVTRQPVPTQAEKALQMVGKKNVDGQAPQQFDCTLNVRPASVILEHPLGDIVPIEGTPANLQFYLDPKFKGTAIPLRLFPGVTNCHTVTDVLNPSEQHLTIPVYGDLSSQQFVVAKADQHSLTAYHLAIRRLAEYAVVFQGSKPIEGLEMGKDFNFNSIDDFDGHMLFLLDQFKFILDVLTQLYPGVNFREFKEYLQYEAWKLLKHLSPGPDGGQYYSSENKSNALLFAIIFHYHSAFFAATLLPLKYTAQVDLIEWYRRATFSAYAATNHVYIGDFAFIHFINSTRPSMFMTYRNLPFVNVFTDFVDPKYPPLRGYINSKEKPVNYKILNNAKKKAAKWIPVNPEEDITELYDIREVFDQYKRPGAAHITEAQIRQNSYYSKVRKAAQEAQEKVEDEALDEYLTQISKAKKLKPSRKQDVAPQVAKPEAQAPVVVEPEVSVVDVTPEIPKSTEYDQPTNPIVLKEMPVYHTRKEKQTAKNTALLQKMQMQFGFDSETSMMAPLPSDSEDDQMIAEIQRKRTKQQITTRNQDGNYHLAFGDTASLSSSKQTALVMTAQTLPRVPEKLHKAGLPAQPKNVSEMSQFVNATYVWLEKQEQSSTQPNNKSQPITEYVEMARILSSQRDSKYLQPMLPLPTEEFIAPEYYTPMILPSVVIDQLAPVVALNTTYFGDIIATQEFQSNQQIGNLVKGNYYAFNAPQIGTTVSDQSQSMFKLYAPFRHADMFTTLQTTFRKPIVDAIVATILSLGNSKAYDLFLKVVKEYQYNYSTILGNFQRFADCIVQNRQTIQNIGKAHFVLSSPWENLQFGINFSNTSLWKFSQLFYSMGLMEKKYGANIAGALPGVKRNPQNSIYEWSLVTQFCQAVDKAALSGKWGSIEAYYADVVMKPKPENYKRAKYFTKGRLIFATNAFAHMPSHFLTFGAKHKIMGHIEGVISPDRIIPILGQDPMDFIRNFIKSIIHRGQVPSSNKGAYYFVYSDNIYIYSLNTAKFYSLDGIKMESQIGPAVLECFLAPFERAAASPKVTAEWIVLAEVYDDVMDMINNCGNSVGMFNVGLLDGAYIDQSVMELIQTICASPVMVESETPIVSRDVVQAYKIKVSQNVNIDVESGNYKSWKAYIDLIKRTFGHFKGNYCQMKFDIPFLPSGHPYTAFLNTVMSYNVIKYWLEICNDPDELVAKLQLNKYLCPFCSFEVTQVNDLAKIFSNKKGDDKQVPLDFLGLHFRNFFEFGYHLQLREESYVCGMIYHTAPGAIDSANTFVVTVGKVVSFIYLGWGIDLEYIRLGLDTIYNRVNTLIRKGILKPKNLREAVYQYVTDSNVIAIKIDPTTNQSSFLSPEWWENTLLQAFDRTHMTTVQGQPGRNLMATQREAYVNAITPLLATYQTKWHQLNLQDDDIEDQQNFDNEEAEEADVAEVVHE